MNMKLLTYFFILCLLVSCTRQIHGLHKVNSNRDNHISRSLSKKTNPVPEEAIAEKPLIVASIDTASGHPLVQLSLQSGIVFIPNKPSITDSTAYRVILTDSLEVTEKIIPKPSKNKQGWGAFIFGIISILTGFCALFLTITVDTNWGMSLRERVSLILLFTLLTGVFGGLSIRGRGRGKGLGIAGITLMCIVLALLLLFGLYVLITPILLFLQ